MLFKNVIYIVLAMVIAPVLSACGNFKYVSSDFYTSNSSFVAMQQFPDDDTAVSAKRTVKKAPKEYGAIIVSSDKKPADQQTAYVLKHSKSKFYAETLLFDNADIKDAKFARSYFSIGADRKKKILGFRLRFEY